MPAAACNYAPANAAAFQPHMPPQDARSPIRALFQVRERAACCFPPVQHRYLPVRVSASFPTIRAHTALRR